MNEREQGSEGEDFKADTNEYAKLGAEAPGYIRTARDLEAYKRTFGPEFGRREEVILDVGAGDSTAADEIEALSDHKAKVVRFDQEYGETSPDGAASAVAGDATKMPFADESFDRVVSHDLMYYLGREKGTEAISEMIRVLRPGGEAVIYPAKPLVRAGTEIGHKERQDRPWPSLVIARPGDFGQWDEVRKQEAYQELARVVTAGKVVTNLIHWGMNLAIRRAGTNRTLDTGAQSSLRVWTKSNPHDRSGA